MNPEVNVAAPSAVTEVNAPDVVVGDWPWAASVVHATQIARAAGIAGAKKPRPYRGVFYPGPAVGPSVACGRNEPCPCGSGRKYKKCCGGS